MTRSSYTPSLIWVDNEQKPNSKSKFRSHIVKESYRRKRVRAREGFSVLPSRQKSTMPEDSHGPMGTEKVIILKTTDIPGVPAWASFNLYDALSTSRPDLFNCLPLRLDPLVESQIHVELQSIFSTTVHRGLYTMTNKYGSNPFQLCAELALQDPLAFRIFVDPTVQLVYARQKGQELHFNCTEYPTPEEHLMRLNVDIFGAIRERLQSHNTQKERLLNTLLSLIARTWRVNDKAFGHIIASHFRGFRSLFYSRQNPWTIHDRSFELRLIIFETCWNDACWSLVCLPTSFTLRLTAFSTFLGDLQIFNSSTIKENSMIADIGQASQATAIDRNSLTYRFLSKEVPTEWWPNRANDESLAQISVLLYLSASLLAYHRDRRKTKTFLSYVDCEVRNRGLDYNESQWCLFWILFLTRDPPISIHSQERVWVVLRHMNVVKTINIQQRVRLKSFLLNVISASSPGKEDGFDIQSLASEVQEGQSACHHCGSRATFGGAHEHSSLCKDPRCYKCSNKEHREAAAKGYQQKTYSEHSRGNPKV